MTKQQAPKTKKQFSELAEEMRRTWKDVLLGAGPRFEIPFPKRGKKKPREELEPTENPHP
jgi:hypothetical protein